LNRNIRWCPWAVKLSLHNI